MKQCRWCDMRGEACQDCVVAIAGPPSEECHLGAEELRALRALADAGLVPPLRFPARRRPADDQPGVPGQRPSDAPWAVPELRAS